MSEITKTSVWIRKTSYGELFTVLLYIVGYGRTALVKFCSFFLIILNEINLNYFIALRCRIEPR